MASLANRDFLSSVALHGAVILIAMNWAPMLRDTPTLYEPLPVELVPVSELTRLMKKQVTEQPQETPDQSETEPVLEPERTRATPEDVPPPVSEPVPQTTSDPLSQPQVEPQVEPKPDPKSEPKSEVKSEPDAPAFEVATPQPLARPAPAKPKLDVNKLRLLLDKTPDTPAPPAAETDVAEMTLSEIDSFRVQMKKCWSFPAGARAGDDLAVIVRVSLMPNGMVSDGPVVVNRNQLTDPFFRAAAESVLRAIRRCQPYQMPAEKYERWRDLELNFDPKFMLGG